MDEHDQAQQALMKMFRRDQTDVIPKRKPRRNPLTNPWLLGMTAVIVVLAPVAFLVIYPRFGPVDTMTAFCRAEGNGDYAAAYALFSPRAATRHARCVHPSEPEHQPGILRHNKWHTVHLWRRRVES